MKFYTTGAQDRGKILVRGYDNGKRFSEAIPYKPYLFIRSNEETAYRTIYGESAGRVDFGSIGDAREFIDKYKDVENFPVYGMTTWLYPYLNDAFPDVEYDVTQIVVANYDIEVHADEFPNAQEAKYPVTAITVSCRGKVYVFGTQPYKPKADNVTYHFCQDEVALLLKFIDVWQSLDPDIVTGWNIDTFDNPYMVNRIRSVLGPEYVLKLSPFGKVNTRTERDGDEELTYYDIVGVESLDYIALYKKFRLKTRESYRLDYIAYVELKKRKLSYKEYGSLQKLYEQNYEKYIDYNIQDVILVDELEARLGYIIMAIAIAYMTGTLYRDAFTSVNLWDVIIHNYLMKQGIVVPPKSGKTKGRKIVGGHVKDVVPGLYKWVVSFDLTSLYPHLIMQYNISPEAFAGFHEPLHIDDDPERAVDMVLNGHLTDEIRQDLKDRNLSLTAGGALFRRDERGFLPVLMERTFNNRKVFKDKKLGHKQEMADIEAEMKHRGMNVEDYKAK